MKSLINLLRKKLWLVILIIILLGIGLYFLFNSRNQSATSRNVTATVSTGSVSRTVSSVGNITAAKLQTGTFSNSSTSTITDIYVKPGDTVKAGQALARIDDSDLQNKLLSADVSLQQANNNLNNTLVKGKYTDYDILNLKQNIRIAQSNYDLAKKNLDNATMKAEFNGIVASSNFIVGQTAGTNSLVVYDPDSLYLNVTFNEYDLSSLTKGTPATITFNSLSGKSYIGQLTDISFNPTITSNVVTYGGKISITANDGALKMGFSGTAVITLEAKDNVLAVPSAAIKNSNNSNYVNLLVNGQLQRQDIQIGIVGDTMTEVTSGLTAGQVIVVSVNTAATTSTNAGSALQLLGGGPAGGGGGNFTRTNTGGGTTRTGN